MTQFVLFSGKGGVGKTTCASATSTALANKGNKTLLISTDPAHSISDIFETEIGDTPTPLFKDIPLSAIELDPTEQFEKNYSDTAEALMGEAERFGVDIDVDNIEGADNGIIGSDEAAMIDMFAEYIDSEWDYVVFDTAPTGHTLRMLKLPEVLDSTVGTLLGVKSQVDTVRNTVSRFVSRGGDDDDQKTLDDVDVDGAREKLRNVRDILKNRDKTQFFAVMEAEQLSYNETSRLLDQLRENEMEIGGVIINKVLTDIDEGCSLCSSRKERQQKVIKDAEDNFDVSTAQLPLFESPPTGGQDIREVAEKINLV